MVAPALVWLTTTGRSIRPDDTDLAIIEVPVDDRAWLQRRQRGDRLELRDSRGSRRKWEVVEVVAGGCLASTEQTSYVMTGLNITCKAGDGQDTVKVGDARQDRPGSPRGAGATG